MSKSSKAELKAYLKETRTWETDKVIQADRLRRIAFAVGAVGLLIGLAGAGAVAMLAPLKTVVPYVVRVDNSTGIVDVMNTLKNSKTDYGEAVNKYFLQKYLRAREGYNRETAAQSYTEVGIMSSNIVLQRYRDYFSPKNPQSPLNLYQDFAKVRITVKSVSFINNDVALVRYVRELDRAPDRPQLSHWAATITFQYVGAPISEADRAINPLGFQVVDYRSDPESLSTIEAHQATPGFTSAAPQAGPASEPASAAIAPESGNQKPPPWVTDAAQNPTQGSSTPAGQK